MLRTIRALARDDASMTPVFTSIASARSLTVSRVAGACAAPGRKLQAFRQPLLAGSACAVHFSEPSGQ